MVVTRSEANPQAGSQQAGVKLLAEKIKTSAKIRSKVTAAIMIIVQIKANGTNQSGIMRVAVSAVGSTLIGNILLSSGIVAEIHAIGATM